MVPSLGCLQVDRPKKGSCSLPWLEGYMAEALHLSCFQLAAPPTQMCQCQRDNMGCSWDTARRAWAGAGHCAWGADAGGLPETCSAGEQLAACGETSVWHYHLFPWDFIPILGAKQCGYLFTINSRGHHRVLRVTVCLQGLKTGRVRKRSSCSLQRLLNSKAQCPVLQQWRTAPVSVVLQRNLSLGQS